MEVNSKNKQFRSVFSLVYYMCRNDKLWRHFNHCTSFLSFKGTTIELNLIVLLVWVATCLQKFLQLLLLASR